jgi:hypothetical protein
VPAVFSQVAPETGLTLLSFAGQQLAASRDQGLHRWLWSLIDGDTINGDSSEAIQERAWAVLGGWYDSYGDSLELSRASVERFFGGVVPFTERLCVVAENPQLTGRFYGSYRFLSVLTTIDEDALTPLAELGALTERLWRALLALAHDPDVFIPDRAAGLRLLGRLARSASQKADLEIQLRPLLDDQDTPADLQRSALAALYLTEAARSDYLGELEARLGRAETYVERSPLEQLIYLLRGLLVETE